MEPLHLELPEEIKEQAPAPDEDAGVFVIDFTIDYAIE